ncbi:MAG: tetratricopeptide repeat protein [Flavobacteriaceae bacterium]|nr:tetratricopeptide repeat protein [Flavobacteriaceae bacterium]
MNKIKYILAFFITTITIAQNDDIFNKGNAFYNEGKFQEAITMYESILTNNVHSAELYFNLANSYYKLNRIAPSIFYYEKALQLEPKDSDILNNLAFAQNMTIDAIEKVPEVGFSKFVKGITNTFSIDVWAIISVSFVVLFVFLFLGYYFSYSTVKKRLAFVSSFVILFFAFIALFFAFQKNAIDKKNNPAIVFSQESDVRTEPNLRSESAFQLHEGTKVQVLENYNNTWTKIQIANGKTGWIAADDIKLLKDI